MSKKDDKAKAFFGNSKSKDVIINSEEGFLNVEDVNKSDISSISTDDLRQELSFRGYKVEKLGQEDVDNKFDIPPEMFESDIVKFAVLSCTQIGSKYQQITNLARFYNYCQEEYGIKLFLHCGDLVDGNKVYKGHEYELFLHGEDAQVDYACNNYPVAKNGARTMVIVGNHDESFMKLGGGNPIRRIAEQRKDIEYVGIYGAYPKINHPKIGKKSLYIHHGEGGVSYARSYKLQKYIEQFSPEQKPHTYFCGHFHISCYLPDYRNVDGFLVPCFQAQTPYLKRRQLSPIIGGYIITMKLNDYGKRGNKVELDLKKSTFYKPIENDY